MSRSAVFDQIPYPSDRTGGLGTVTYAEWCYTIGMFQSLIFSHLPARPVKMLDVGCGAGRLYLAAKPYLTQSDSYTGIDIDNSFLDRCRKLYRDPGVNFIHTPSSNGYYSKETEGGPRSWPFKNESYNLVTALSVWTHLNEEDWLFYLNEVSRILQPGGRAIISFFILDEDYKPESKRNKMSQFYPQSEDKWVFSESAYGSEHWKCPSWVDVPEVAIGVDKAQFDAAVEQAGLKVKEYRSGQWKDHPGFFFQDIIVFEKS